jgi:hypothetical protein
VVRRFGRKRNLSAAKPVLLLRELSQTPPRTSGRITLFGHICLPRYAREFRTLVCWVPKETSRAVGRKTAYQGSSHPFILSREARTIATVSRTISRT